MGGVERRIEVGPSVVEVEADGLLAFRLGPIDVSPAHITALLEVQYSLGARKVPILIDSRRALSMSRAAMELTASPKLRDYNTCVAVLVDSPVSVVLGNFFTVFVRPPYPTKLFRSEDAARAWIASLGTARP